MKIAIYTRVSTEEQSIDMQLSDLRKFVEQKGYINHEEYSDIGYSGSRNDRPGLNRLMEDVKNGKIDIVCVWRFDRFSRSLRHLVNTLYDLDQLGVKFISLKENLDTSTSIGRLQFAVISAMTEFERELIKERVIGGIQRAKEKGIKLGRPSITTEEIISRIRTFRNDGYTIREIASKTGISKSLVDKIIGLYIKKYKKKRIR